MKTEYTATVPQSLYAKFISAKLRCKQGNVFIFIGYSVPIGSVKKLSDQNLRPVSIKLLPEFNELFLP